MAYDATAAELLEHVNELEAENAKLRNAIESWKRDEETWRKTERALKKHAEAMAETILAWRYSEARGSLAAYRRDFPKEAQ